jgi:hypothetical protein
VSLQETSESQKVVKCANKNKAFPFYRGENGGAEQNQPRGEQFLQRSSLRHILVYGLNLSECQVVIMYCKKISFKSLCNKFVELPGMEMLKK